MNSAVVGLITSSTLLIILLSVYRKARLLKGDYVHERFKSPDLHIYSPLLRKIKKLLTLEKIYILYIQYKVKRMKVFTLNPGQSCEREITFAKKKEILSFQFF